MHECLGCACIFSTLCLYKDLIIDSRGVLQKFRFTESMPHYNSSHLSFVYPALQIQETSLEAHIRDIIIVRTGSVNKGKFPERLPQDCLRSQEFLLQHEIELWVQFIGQRILQNIFIVKSA